MSLSHLHRSQSALKDTAAEQKELSQRGYKLGKKLGEGSYATVFSAYSTERHKHVAIKIIQLDSAPPEFISKFLPRELQILEAIEHPNIVRMYEKFDIKLLNVKGKPENMTYVVMEVAGHGDLLEFIKLRARLSEGKAKFFMRQLVEAVDYLHLKSIIHRDIKCENLLLDSVNNLKLSDFGFARYLRTDEESKTFCGSAAYAAPEVLKGEPYSGFGFDMWSIGIILFIMVCGRMPFEESEFDDLHKSQFDAKLDYPEHLEQLLTNDLKLLIKHLLTVSVAKRATMVDVRKSGWISDVPHFVVNSIDEFRTVIGHLEHGPKGKFPSKLSIKEQSSRMDSLVNSSIGDIVPQPTEAATPQVKKRTMKESIINLVGKLKYKKSSTSKSTFT